MFEMYLMSLKKRKLIDIKAEDEYETNDIKITKLFLGVD